MAAAGGYVHNLVETSPNGQNKPSALSATPFYHPLTQADWQVPILWDDRSDELRGFSDNVQPDLVGYDPQVWGANLRLYPNLFGLYMHTMHGNATYVAAAACLPRPVRLHPATRLCPGADPGAGGW